MARLKIFADRSILSEGERKELNLVNIQWKVYFDGVKSVLKIGRTAAPMAVVMLGATDEHFQTIASHLSAMSGLIIRRTASTVDCAASAWRIHSPCPSAPSRCGSTPRDRQVGGLGRGVITGARMSCSTAEPGR
jgi:hypothetical protein